MALTPSPLNIVLNRELGVIKEMGVPHIVDLDAFPVQSSKVRRVD